MALKETVAKANTALMNILSSLLSFSSVVMIGLDSSVYSVMEGESMTATVSVIPDDVTLDRDVVVTLMTADNTATTGQVHSI